MYSKKITSASKQENNKRRLQEALARTLHEKLIFFLKPITNFNPGKSFSSTLNASDFVKSKDLKYDVLIFNDLIQSKISSTRPKDRLDLEEIYRIRLENNG